MGVPDFENIRRWYQFLARNPWVLATVAFASGIALTAIVLLQLPQWRSRMVVGAALSVPDGQHPARVWGRRANPAPLEHPEPNAYCTVAPVLITLESIRLEPSFASPQPEFRLVIGLNGSVYSFPTRAITVSSEALRYNPESLVAYAAEPPFPLDLELVVPDLAGTFPVRAVQVPTLPYLVDVSPPFRAGGTDAVLAS